MTYFDARRDPHRRLFDQYVIPHIDEVEIYKFPDIVMMSEEFSGYGKDLIDYINQETVQKALFPSESTNINYTEFKLAFNDLKMLYKKEIEDNQIRKQLLNLYKSHTEKSKMSSKYIFKVFNAIDAYSHLKKSTITAAKKKVIKKRTSCTFDELLKIERKLTRNSTTRDPQFVKSPVSSPPSSTSKSPLVKKGSMPSEEILETPEKENFEPTRADMIKQLFHQLDTKNQDVLDVDALKKGFGHHLSDEEIVNLMKSINDTEPHSLNLIQFNRFMRDYEQLATKK